MKTPLKIGVRLCFTKLWQTVMTALLPARGPLYSNRQGHEKAEYMFRFTIRDVLWLTTLVAIGTVWRMDRDKIRRDRVSMVKREADLTSRAKMWENKADRAEQRIVDTREMLSGRPRFPSAAPTRALPAKPNP